MLLGAGAAVLVLGGIRATAWLIGPAFLALIVVIALYPVQAWEFATAERDRSPAGGLDLVGHLSVALA